jgi:hypothetical protein
MEFDGTKGLVWDDTELSHDELRLLLAHTSRANGWEDPGMEEYDNYDERKILIGEISPLAGSTASGSKTGNRLPRRGNRIV